MRRIQLAAVALLIAFLLLAGTTSAAPTWLAPQDLSDAGRDAVLPQVAADGAGDVFAVWERYNGAIWVVQAAQRPAGGDWTASQDLSGSGGGGDAQLAVDPAGNAVAVWESADAHFGVQAARRPAGEAWTAPQDLSPADEPSQSPQVALDPAGNAIAIWQSWNGATHVIEASRRPAGGAWSAPQVLSAVGQDAELPQVALDASGGAVAAWVRHTGSSDVVQAASQPAGGTWRAAQDLSAEDAHPPQLAVDQAGDAVVVWARTAGIVRAAERPAGGAWGAPRDLSLASQDASDPDVAMGPSGSAVAVWERFDGSNYIVQARRQRVFGGGWGTRFDLSAPGRTEGAFPVQVALGESGDALAAWVRFDATGRQIVQAAREPGTTTWDPAQDLSASGQDAHYPQVAVDPAGNAVAAWIRSDGSHGIVQAAGLDAAGPLLSGVSIPSHGTSGKRLSFSLSSALDVWSPLSGQPEWFFGDGAGAGGTKVTHVYEPGTYRVTVSQADAVGNITSSSGYLTIDPARCVVPRVVGLTLKRARAAIKKRHCRTGKVRRAFSSRLRTGRILAQRPKAGKRLANGARVNLVVSRGRRR
jgi:hypothetical protein